MAINPFVNKVVYGNQTIMDISDTTAVAADVASGKYFYTAAGQKVQGTASGGGGAAVSIVDTLDAGGGTIRTITAVDLSGITVSEAHLESGYTAVDSLGNMITGTLNPGGGGGNYQAKTGINPTTSSQTIRPDTGYDALSSVQINAMPSGTVTAPSSISGSSATVSTGTNTLTLTKTVSVTPNVTTAGYVSSGTAGNSSVSLTASVTTKAAATITPGTSNQTIASGTYLTGTQTIAGDADLVASNILSTANIFGVQGNVVIQHYYTGSGAPASSLGVNGDIYLQT